MPRRKIPRRKVLVERLAQVATAEEANGSTARKPPALLQGIATVIAGFLDGLVAKSLRVWLTEKAGRKMVVSSDAEGLEFKFFDGGREVDAPISFDISKGFFE